MNEITEFEESLRNGQSFEESIQKFFYKLLECVDPESWEAFRAIWAASLENMPTNDQLTSLLAEIKLEFSRYAQFSDAMEDGYAHSFRVCWIHALAAQRAYSRSNKDDACLLLMKAQESHELFAVNHARLFKIQVKSDRVVQAATNAGLHAQRVKYQIIMLLHRDRQKRGHSKFKNVKQAINRINDEIARFIDENELNISYNNLEETARNWKNSDPAFRAEIEPFLDIRVVSSKLRGPDPS